MTESVTICPGRPEFANDAAILIYESSHELFEFMFSSRPTAENVLSRLYRSERGHFSHRFSTIAMQGDKVAGLQLGYDLEQLSSQELVGGIALFINSPARYWWRLISRVGPVLDKYVPKPRSNAYYINNIAVAAAGRGGGIGRLLLTDTLNHANEKGYDSVELDVTAVNDSAIRFYEKNGFVRVFESGTAELHTRYGLPRLVRMAHRLRNTPRDSQEAFRFDNPLIVNEVTHLYSTRVDAVFAPGTVEQLQEFVSNTSAPISVGGGRFSMGGQIAAENSIHIDMRGLDRVVAFDPANAVLRAQAGMRWRQIQSLIDGYGLAVKIMQTYSDFTVGGAISVNCHGRYVGLGPLVLSVRSLRVLLHDGALIETSPKRRKEVFYSVVGGYGAAGIIVEAELDLTRNTRVERTRKKLAVDDYPGFFSSTVRDDTTAVFHNADIYPPHFQKASAVTWRVTEEPPSTQHRLNPGRRLYLGEKYLMWAITEAPLGKWRREMLVDPIIYARKKVHWRNFEAGYHVAELEPVLRDRRTYVLQEYFVPVNEFLSFTRQMAEILNRYRVNVVNVSVRHAHADPGTLLAWAREEVFAFVLYYKQRTRRNAKERVAVWTRELIDAAISHRGAYYLPYQPHATPEQFNAAYPNAKKFFAVKSRLDPEYRFRNCLWDRYYKPKNTRREKKKSDFSSEFSTVYNDVALRDDFYRFLQNVYHLYPEDRFHTLIMEACERYSNDESIYNHIKDNLGKIKPTLGEFTYALPSLIKQKKVITEQTKQLLGEKSFNGYLEIGSTGRYVRSLRKVNIVKGPIHITHENLPDMSPPEIMERGQLKQAGHFFPLNNYAPFGREIIADNSVDLVTCYIGLHHCAPSKIESYIGSVRRVLRNGGMFVLRDHDARSEQMKTFVSLVHTVFNAGLGIEWATNQKEERYFNGLDHWVDCLSAAGFNDVGERIRQDHDPSANTLMAFWSR